MTDKERDELLINMANDMKKRDELLINMANDVKNLKNDMKNVINDMNNVKSDMKEIKKEQRSLSRAVAKIEVEHGEKLQILLDVVTGQEEKNEEFERRFEEDEKILDRHSDQIYYLQLKANKRKPIL